MSAQRKNPEARRGHYTLPGQLSSIGNAAQAVPVSRTRPLPEARPGFDQVVVEHPQRPEVVPARVVVVGEGEVEAALQPPRGL